MLFNSYIFIFLFLPITLGGYALACRHSNRLAMGWLVVCSLFFYGWWNPIFLWLILLSVSVNFISGSYLNRNPKKRVLAIAIAFNLFLLGYYKYAGFLTGIISSATGTSFSFGDILLPLGISFFTFQQIAYLVDSYKRLTVSHGWLEYGLFVTFFPQLIAGPIVHQAEMLPQFMRGKRGLVARNLSIGLTIFILGLFKKVVIADNMAVYSTPMFNAANAGETITFLEAWGGSLAYTLQIYFDFSGYSDMAIGLARLFGVKLPLNFNSPYKALNIIDFWRRWHMTLSRFFRDYLYFPLGGNKWGPTRSYLNLMIVMLLGGLWHGAGWTFVFWGFLHGFYLTCNHAWRMGRQYLGFAPGASSPLGQAASWLMTFSSVVVAWVFFRAESWDTAINILHGMTGMDGRLVVTVGYAPIAQWLAPIIGSVKVSAAPLVYFDGRSQIGWLAMVLALALALPNTQQWMRRYIPSADAVDPARRLPRTAFWRPTPAWAVFTIALVSVALISALQPSEFLYWQF